MLVAIVVGVVVVALLLVAFTTVWFWWLRKDGRRYKNVPPYESAFPGESSRAPGMPSVSVTLDFLLHSQPT